MSKKDEQNLKELIKKPELYLGIATLVIVSIFILKATYKPIARVAKIVPTIIAIKPTPSIVPTKVVVAKQIITPTIAIKKSIKQIKKFADTGVSQIQVKEGDNFWKIAEKVCGNGIFGEEIQAQNGYKERKLQPGDSLVVSCN